MCPVLEYRTDCCRISSTLSLGGWGCWDLGKKVSKSSELIKGKWLREAL